jgi:AcrR family transcriptional regulator
MATVTAERIVAAARAILTEEGSDAVSMRRVASSVGLTPMAIYRHYPNREALLEVVADRIFAELAVDWGKWTWPTGSDREEQLVAALNEHLDFALGEPRLYSFLFTERRANARRYPEDFRSGGSPTLNALISLLTDGIRTGDLREHDVLESAMIISATVHGLVQLYHGDRIGLPEAEFRTLCHTAVRRILDGLEA